MKAEDVPDELVEKAGRAMYESRAIELDQDGDTGWSALPGPWRKEWREGARHALAAVLPGIQAQALREVADVVKRYTGRLESADGADEVVSLIESVIRQRAARLTATADGTTT